MFGEALVWYTQNLFAFWRSSPAGLIIMMIMLSWLFRTMCSRRRGGWGWGCCCRCSCCGRGSASCGPDCTCHPEADAE